MSSSAPVRAVTALKRRSPESLKRIADVSTRSYAVATARWRPYPDFLIAGTKRGGTTSLWNYLLEHPQVLPMFPAPRGVKSNAFFFENLDRSDAWYRSHFHTSAYRRFRERRVGRTVTGEASPYYMYGPHAIAHIAARMPTIRLIVLLRDPVQRAYGHYQERRKAGTEPLTFDDALAAEEARLSSDADRRQEDPTYYSRSHDIYSYRDRGIYLPQIRRIHQHLPSENVLILRSEDLYEDEAQVFAEVCRFLGIDDAVAVRDPRQHNYIERSPIAPETAAELYDFYRPHNEALFEYLGRSFGWPDRPGDQVRS
jgi:hypothetical protein